MPGTRRPVHGVRDEHAGLRHPVALEAHLAGARRDARVEIRRERRGARHEQAQPRERRRARVIGEAVQHGRDAEEQRGLFALHCVEHRVGIEARQQQRGRARLERAVQRDAEAVHVEERQRVHEAIVGCPAPREAQRFGRGVEVPVREQRSLRPPGRARGVGEQRRRAPARRRRARAPGRRSARARASVRAVAGSSAASCAPRSASSTSAARGCASASSCASSAARYAGFAGSTTRPSRRQPTWATASASELAALTSTRSPARSPAACRRPAARADSASSWPHESRVPRSSAEGWPLGRRPPVRRPGGRQRARREARRIEGRARRQVHAPARGHGARG